MSGLSGDPPTNHNVKKTKKQPSRQHLRSALSVPILRGARLVDLSGVETLRLGTSSNHTAASNHPTVAKFSQAAHRTWMDQTQIVNSSDGECLYGPPLTDPVKIQRADRSTEAALSERPSRRGGYSEGLTLRGFRTATLAVDSMEPLTTPVPVTVSSAEHSLTSLRNASPFRIPGMSNDIPLPERDRKVSPVDPKSASFRRERTLVRDSKQLELHGLQLSRAKPRLHISPIPDLSEVGRQNELHVMARGLPTPTPSSTVKRRSHRNISRKSPSSSGTQAKSSATWTTSESKGFAIIADETEMAGPSLEVLSAGESSKLPGSKRTILRPTLHTDLFPTLSLSQCTPKSVHRPFGPLRLPPHWPQSVMDQVHDHQALRQNISPILYGLDNSTTHDPTVLARTPYLRPTQTRPTLQPTTIAPELALQYQTQHTLTDTTIIPDLITAHQEQQVWKITQIMELLMRNGERQVLPETSARHERCENLTMRTGREEALKLDTAATPCRKRDLALTESAATRLVSPRENQDADLSPLSPVDGDSIFNSDEEVYGTPLTSAESSPINSRPPLRYFPALERVLPQLDGGRGSTEDVLTQRPDYVPLPTSTRTLIESDTRSVLQLLRENEEVLSEVDGSGPSTKTDREDVDNRPRARIKPRRLSLRAPSHDKDLDESTPLVAASPAKGAQGFPLQFLASASDALSIKGLQRHPSSLKRYCERQTTIRRRRHNTTGLLTPDRFIANRPSTPAKEVLAVSKPASTSSGPNGSPRRVSPPSDPFASSPRQGFRTSEQYATLRAPAPTPRQVGEASLLPLEVNRQRAPNTGSMWSVGGTPVTEGVASTTNGRGGRVTSGTNAPHYIADFIRKRSTSELELQHRRRLAIAMDIQGTTRTLIHSSPTSPQSPSNGHIACSPFTRIWRDGRWDHDGPPNTIKPPTRRSRDIPIIPFRVLDAPSLRDDFYCSLLAYSPTIHCLAVGLGPHVYLWSESRGSVNNNLPDSLTAPHSGHVSSIAFSSLEGGNAILAIGRADGRITLWSPLDREPRFDSEQPAGVSCVCWRPSPVRRSSIRDSVMMVATDELLVGDEVGHVYYYSVEWPSHDQRDLFGWHGSMTLLARIHCHTQQVCGIAWTPDGSCFASGGNDNLLYLFETKKVLKCRLGTNHDSDASIKVRSGITDVSSASVTGKGGVLNITSGQHKHLFTMNAAVKAVAFAPWQPSLLAAGGGSNDRCIHFFHTMSGANLANIDCYAQVTSLVWSERRKEIAATFGFAQPDHPFRVAVFSWPSCRMVVGIPWWGEERALYSVPYPRGPTGGLESPARGRADAEGRAWYGRRSREEGCLVVATSDASIKFHEIWTERPQGGKSRASSGVLGGSQILEGECSPAVEQSGIIR